MNSHSKDSILGYSKKFIKINFTCFFALFWCVSILYFCVKIGSWKIHVFKIFLVPPHVVEAPSPQTSSVQTQILKNYSRKTKVQKEENQIQKVAWVFLFF